MATILCLGSCWSAMLQQEKKRTEISGVEPQDIASWTHLAKMSAWARLSPIISRNERLSSMKDGREMRVMSIPTRSCARMWKITDL